MILTHHGINSFLENSFLDKVLIGDKYYKFVQIGDQIWLAENLDYQFDGLVVGQGASSGGPRANYYNNDESTYGDKYGLMYNWTAVKYLEDHNSELIPGWHVPTTGEWNALANAVGGQSVAGTKLKSTTGWTSGNGTDDYGFAVFPAGYGYDSSFYGLGTNARFWTATEYSSKYAYYHGFDTGASMGEYNEVKTRFSFSIRLVKD